MHFGCAVFRHLDLERSQESVRDNRFYACEPPRILSDGVGRFRLFSWQPEKQHLFCSLHEHELFGAGVVDVESSVGHRAIVTPLLGDVGVVALGSGQIAADHMLSDAPTAGHMPAHGVSPFHPDGVVVARGQKHALGSRLLAHTALTAFFWSVQIFDKLLKSRFD